MTPSSVGGSGSTSNTVCDMDEAERSKYEKAGTQTATSSSGGYTATVKSITHCTKQ